MHGSVAKHVGDPVRQGETLATVESNESLQPYAARAATGVVTARDANPGEQTGERALFMVADLSTVWVELALFPRDLPGPDGTVRARGGPSPPPGLPTARSSYIAPFGSTSLLGR